MVDSTSIATILLLSSASGLLLAAMLYPAALLRWFQRKRYQYEVTFSLYMLTPTEKFIFNSILFLLLSLLIIAASLYLPEHVKVIASRVFYYFSGNQQHLAPGERSPLQPPMDPNPAYAAQGALAGKGAGYMAQ